MRALALFHPGRMKNHAWQGQFYPLIIQALQNTDVDLLLDIHVLVVIRRVDDMHHFKGEPVLIKTQQMGAVEARFTNIRDNLFHVIANDP